MGKIIQFFVEVKSELFKVVWPSKMDTLRYTGIVILFSVLIALILGAADYGLIKLVERLANK